MTDAIINMIIESVNDHLTELLQDDVDTSDSTRAGLVRPGLLQDDPTRFKVSVMTFPNDPDADGQWRHEIVVPNANGAEHNPPPYELGGGEMWYRRFTVQLEMFFSTRITRDNARQLAAVIISRAERSVALAPVALGIDEFGEEPLQTRVMSSTLTQGGGEGQFIWYGKIWFQVLTGKTL